MFVTHYWLSSPTHRLYYLKVVLSLASWSGFLLCWPLWLSNRDFPLVPVVEGLSIRAAHLDYAILAALSLLPLMILNASRPGKLIMALIILLVGLCLLDQMRWQPWVLVYLGLWMAIGNYDSAQTTALATGRIILLACYFWSGVQKLNVSFLQKVIPYLFDPYEARLLGHRNVLPWWAGLAIPLLEIGIAFGLFTQKYRRAAVVLAVLLHLAILTVLIPLGRNVVIWPWNAAMGAAVVILFWQQPISKLKEWLPQGKAGPKIAVLVFGFLPLLSFFNRWDAYWSFSLYSGNTVEGMIYLPASMKNRLPATMHPYLQAKKGTDSLVLYPQAWAFGELHVPIYPELRVFRQVARSLGRYANDSCQVRLEVHEKPNWQTGKRVKRLYLCAGLTEPIPD
jgi:hypothetical protein